MENKQNFTGIIIPVIVAVILLTVLPIINSINEECPPCEECPIYNIGNMEVNPNFSSGNYTVDKGDYDYLDNVTIVKDDNLISENIIKDVNIFGVVGTFECPSYNIGNIEVNPDFSSGNYAVDKGSYDYLDTVTIVKDNNLIPENIKKGVNIFGIDGTLESEGELPLIPQENGVVFVSGHHHNFSTTSEILPPEGRLVCNDGTNDLYIDGTLISFRQPTGREAINYSFIFSIPRNYTIKEFELKSEIEWDRDYRSSEATSISSWGEVSSIDVSMDSGYTTPNQFSRIFSFTTPRTMGFLVSVIIKTYKD